MGKGDMKSRRGKLFAGSFGVRRSKKTKNVIKSTIKAKAAPVKTEKPAKAAAPAETKKPAPKKASKPKKESAEKAPEASAE